MVSTSSFLRLETRKFSNLATRKSAWETATCSAWIRKSFRTSWASVTSKLSRTQLILLLTTCSNFLRKTRGSCSINWPRKPHLLTSSSRKKIKGRTSTRQRGFPSQTSTLALVLRMTTKNRKNWESLTSLLVLSLRTVRHSYRDSECWTRTLQRSKKFFLISRPSTKSLWR